MSVCPCFSPFLTLICPHPAAQDEDGDAVEAICLDEAFDPLIVKFKDWLFHRALKPDEPLPPLREDVAA